MAKKAIDRLHEITKDVTMLTWRRSLIYLEGLYLYAIGEMEQGLSEIDKSKLIYNLTGNTFMIEQMNSGLEMIQNKKDKKRK